MSGKLHFLPLPPRGKYTRYPLQRVVMWYKINNISEKSAASIFTYPEDRLRTLYITLQSVISQKIVFFYIIYLPIHVFISLYDFDYSVFSFFVVYLEILGVDGWIILGWNSRRWDVGIWTGLGWPRIETGDGRL